MKVMHTKPAVPRVGCLPWRGRGPFAGDMQFIFQGMARHTQPRRLP